MNEPLRSPLSPGEYELSGLDDETKFVRHVHLPIYDDAPDTT